MNPIGIMQGRLTPPVSGRIQAFPGESWRDEFPRARSVGLDCIEWIFEEPEAANPLATDGGVEDILRSALATGVTVRSVCADFYMKHRLLDDLGVPVETAWGHLEWLVGRAGLVGARHVVVPFVDASSLRGAPATGPLEERLRRIAPTCARAGVELHLETDLPPAAFAGLLRRAGGAWVRANHDMGNSASLGYDPREELPALGPWLGSVHVKDRRRGGSTVPLGEGDTDFARVFEELRALRYAGVLILQAARVPGLSEAELASRNRKFVEARIAEAGPWT
jgi:hexulose-6-phosphate isomerase